MSCCCSCFSFLKCCDCCGGACDGKKDKKVKHLDDPYGHHAASTSPFHPAGGYHAPAPMPMMAGGLKAEPPQYAQFDVGKNGLAVAPTVNEDALPPMPSWDSAAKKHVLTEEEKNAVELGELDPATGQKVPLMAGAAAPGNSMPTSPVNEMGATPYGERPGQGDANGYIRMAGDAYGQNNSSFNSNGGYRDSPAGSGRGYGSPPQDQYAYNNFNGPAGPAFDRPIPQRQNTGDANGQYPGSLSRQYTGNSAFDRQYSDRPPQSTGFNQGSRGPSRGPHADNFQPPRGPSRGPGDNFQPRGPSRGPNGNPNQPPRGPSRGAPTRMASPPQNDSGFDFSTQDYPRSRPTPPPQQPSYNSGRRPSPPMTSNDGYYESNATSYQSQGPTREQYSAYQPPEPVSNHQRAPTALRPGNGRDRREPQGWDPVNH